MAEENRKEVHKKICVHLAIVICGLLLLIFVLPKLARFFAPLIIAWIIAMMANPFVRFLERRIKIMRKHGSAIVIVFVIVVIVGLLYAVLGTLFSQIGSMIDTLPDVYETVLDNLQAFAQSLHKKYHIIPGNINKLFQITKVK